VKQVPNKEIAVSNMPPHEGSLEAALGMAIDPSPKAAPIMQCNVKSTPSVVCGKK
jgi:hypothetical protein